MVLKPLPNENLSKTIVFLIASIPKGKIATYGHIAKLAGNPRAARLVSWLLHSSSHKKKLPWHRVINSQGRISLPWEPYGKRQFKLLKLEGVAPNSSKRYDLNKYLWQPL